MGLVCLILALLCFVLAAFGVRFEHVDVTNIGLAFFVAAGIVGDVRMPWNRSAA